VSIEKLKKSFDIDIKWIAYPLHPETPKEGISMKEVYVAENLDFDQAMARLKKAASEAGLPFGERKKRYNSRQAQELGKWAETKDKGD
jgi:predicted DsbA family dithiol-disulfide isomerase